MPLLTEMPQVATGPRPGTLRHRLTHPGVFLFVVLSAQMMVVLDATIVNVALPHIEQGLRFSSSGLSWVLNAYVLTFGGLLLLGARAGDLAGRKRIFLAGIALFSLSSLFGGLATTSSMLLGARALQGIGAAMAAPQALALITTVFAEGAARVRAIGMFTTVSAAGGAVGLVMGGILTQLASWRWVMFVNVPIGIVILLLGRIVLQETEPRHGHFDLTGAIASTVGMTGVVLGLIEAGNKGWGSPVTLASFAVGFTLLGVFVTVERRAEEPILPLRLMANATRATANIARGLLYAGMFSMFFFMVQFLQDVKGLSPVEAGLAFLPIPLSVFTSSQITSRYLVSRVPQKWLMLTGIGLGGLSLLWASNLGLGTPFAVIAAQLVLMGLGMGMSYVSLTTASLAGVAPEDSGAASGLVNVFQQVGGALGLAVLVTAFGFFTHHAQLSGSVVGSAHVQATLVAGLDDVFTVAALFALMAFLSVAAFVPSRAGASDAAGAATNDVGEPAVVDLAPPVLPPLRGGTVVAASAMWADAEAS